MDIIRIAEVLISAGLGYIIKSAWDLFVRRKEEQSPNAKATFQLTHTTQQVDLLARVNSELEADITRLRTVLRASEDHARTSELSWQQREAEWVAERRLLQAELDAMHEKVRILMEEIETLQRRWATNAGPRHSA